MLFKKDILTSLFLFSLILFTPSYAEKKETAPLEISNLSIKYGFGVNFITPFAFFDAPYIPYGITGKNYANTISAVSSFQPFIGKQYSLKEKGNDNISSYDNLNTLVYDLTTYASFVFDKHYVLKINFDFLIANKHDESYGKGFILDENTPGNYIGVIEGNRDNTFSLYGFTFGPEFNYQFNELKDLPLSFLLGTSFNMGTFFLLQNTTNVKGNVSFLPGTSLPSHKGGDLKTSDDLVSDGLLQHSTYSEQEVTSYVNPFMFQWKIIAGMDIRLSKLVTSELFIGFVLTYLNIEKLKIKIERSATPITGVAGNPQTLKMEKPGFQKTVPSFIVGVSLFFNVKN